MGIKFKDLNNLSSNRYRITMDAINTFYKMKEEGQLDSYLLEGKNIVEDLINLHTKTPTDDNPSKLK